MFPSNYLYIVNLLPILIPGITTKLIEFIFQTYTLFKMFVKPKYFSRNRKPKKSFKQKIHNRKTYGVMLEKICVGIYLYMQILKKLSMKIEYEISKK